MGAENMNGDTYSPLYSARTASVNSIYAAENYYDYAVEMPPGASGHVYLRSR